MPSHPSVYTALAATNFPSQQSFQLPLMRWENYEEVPWVYAWIARLLSTPAMGPYELGVTNALWQKAFTPEWGATRKQAGAKVKRAASQCLMSWSYWMYLHIVLLGRFGVCCSFECIRHASMPTGTFWFKVFPKMADKGESLKRESLRSKTCCWHNLFFLC